MTDTAAACQARDPETAPVDLGVTFRSLLDGGGTWEMARDVAFDDAGAMYVVGGTTGADFPTTEGAYDRTYNTGGTQVGRAGENDAFVTKIDSSGRIVWSTFLGGPNYDRAYAVEVDAEHDVYVAGRAGPGFPTTSGVVQPEFAGDDKINKEYGPQDGFVAKLSADGTKLLWATYFGDTGFAIIRDLDVDAEKRVHLGVGAVSGTSMDAYVTAGAHQPRRKGQFDTFYARLSPDASGVEVGTYLGGDDDIGDYSPAPSVRALPDGGAYLLTIEPGPGAPTTPGAFQRESAGERDMLLARFAPDGTVVFVTYVGGSGDERMDTHSLALDPLGRPVIAVESSSPDYPLTDSSPAGGKSDVVVSLLSADGAKLLASTRIGGDGADVPEGVSVDGSGNVYVSGFTLSSTLPVTPNALSSTYTGSREGLLIVLSCDLATRRLVSYDGIPGRYANRSSLVSQDGLRWAVVGAAWRIDPFPSTFGDARIDGEHAAFYSLLSPR